MSKDIKITISGNDAAMIAVWQRQQAQILKNQAALEKLAQSGEKAGRNISSGAEGGMASFAKFAGSIVGVGSAVAGVAAIANVLKREYEDLLKRQKAAADMQISLADAQTQELMNLGQDKEVDAKRLLQLNREGAQKTGMSERDFTIAMSDALSARGDRSAMEAHRATVAAGSLLPYNPEAAKLLSGAALDVGKKANMSPEAAIGVLSSIGRSARVTGMQGTAEHIAPGALGVMGFGDNIKQAGGLLAAISLGENDPTGRRSRTASISLGQQLEERFPELKNTEERIRKVQAGGDKEWKKFFEGGKYKVGGKTKKFEGASFEATALPTIRGLLRADANTQERKEYESSLQNTASPEEGLQIYNDLMRDKDALRSVQAARKQRYFEGEAESAQIDDTAAAAESISREGVQKALAAHGVGWVARKMAAAGYEVDVALGGTPEEAAATAFRDNAKRLRGVPLDDEGKTFAGAPKDQASADKLVRMAAGLEELVKLQKERIEQADKQHADRPRNEPVPLAGPGAANQR